LKPFGPETKWDKNGEEVSPAENGFIITKYPQIVSVDSKFFTFSS